MTVVGSSILCSLQCIHYKLFHKIGSNGRLIVEQKAKVIVFEEVNFTVT